MNKKLITTIIATILMIGLASAEAPTDNLNIYFTFNHTGTTLPIDYGSDANDNSLVNSDSFTVGFASYTTGTGSDGGNEISLNGDMPDNDIFVTGTDTGLTMATGEDFSLCGIFEPQSTGADLMVFRQDSDTFNIFLDAGTWYAQLNGNYVDTGSYNHAYGSKEHICLIFDNTANTFSVYSNATYQSQKTGVSQEPTFTNKQIAFGARGQWNREYNGTIQHLRLWLNKSLTPTEITDTYNEDTGGEGEEEEPTNVTGNLVLDLSFNNITDCGNDDTGLHADFTTSGDANCIEDTTICKWFGCVNLTNDGGDYLSGISNFELGENLSVMFWVNPSQTPGQPSSQGYFDIGNSETSNYLYTEEGDYGISSKWNAETGLIDVNPGESHTTLANTWTHYAITYDGINFKIYKNKILIKESAQSHGTINYTTGSIIRAGIGKYNIDLIGLMDEFKIYNKTLNEQEITEAYDEQVSGTPLDYDIYIKNVTKSGDNLQYTIKNSGIYNITDTFSSRLYTDGSITCTNQTTGGLNTGEEITYSCPAPTWDTGVHTIRVVIDYLDEVSEGEGESNNAISFPYNTQPFPRLHPELNTAWIASNTDSPAYKAHNSLKNFASEDFDPGWTAVNVDPRGKKGWENALSCYFTGYVSTSGQDECGRAINHLEGWLNGTISANDYAEATVQSTHEIASLALTFDIMYNNLTQTQRDVYASSMVDICTELYKTTSINLQNDEEELFPGNGKGFGSGFGYPCWTVSGLVDSNPGIIAIPPGGLEQFSINDGWVNRIKWYLQGSQGDRSAEGITYNNYGLYHTPLMAKAIIDSNYTTINDSDTDGLLIGMSNYLLDFNNFGTNIGDRNQKAKFYSFGDSHPYDELGEINQVGASLYTTLGVLSNNQTIKDIAYTTRNLLATRDGTITANRQPTLDIWFYPLLATSATNLTAQEMTEAIGTGTIGRTWDYLYLRNNRTYIDDTVIIIDGGDKPAWGHSQAEFSLYVYAMGENWLDYGAVPFDDDIRSEYWQNTLSLKDDDGAYYWADAYSAPLNQPYGGATTAYRTEYPNAEFMPDYSRGSINDTFILTNEEGFGGGTRMFQKYLYNATGLVERRIIAYEDFIIEAYILNRTETGFASMSFLNYLELYPGTTSETNLSYTHGTKTYEVSVLHSTTPLTLSGGDTGKLAGDEKTSYGGFNVTYQRYEYSTENADEEVFIFLHHWYDGTSEEYTIINEGGQYGISTQGNNATITLDDTEWYYISTTGATPPEEPEEPPAEETSTEDTCNTVSNAITPPLLIISIIVGLLLILGVIDTMIAGLIIAPIVLTIATACI